MGGCGERVGDFAHVGANELVGNVDGIVALLIRMMVARKIAQDLKGVQIVLVPVDLDVHASTMDDEVDVFVSVPFFRFNNYPKVFERFFECKSFRSTVQIHNAIIPCPRFVQKSGVG